MKPKGSNITNTIQRYQQYRRIRFLSLNQGLKDRFQNGADRNQQANGDG